MAAMERLNKYLDEMEARVPDREMKAEVISAAKVAWQLDHSLKVLIQIAAALKTADPAEFQPSFNLRWFILSKLNWFPRGKGKAPKALGSEGEISETSLLEQINQARVLLTELNHLPPNSFFLHPLFGPLKLSSALHFIKIHTYHHLKIVRDIIKQQAQ